MKYVELADAEYLVVRDLIQQKIKMVENITRKTLDETNKAREYRLILDGAFSALVQANNT